MAKLWYPEYDIQHWQQWLVYVALCWTTVALNVLGSKIIPLFNQIICKFCLISATLRLMKLQWSLPAPLSQLHLSHCWYVLAADIRQHHKFSETLQVQQGGLAMGFPSCWPFQTQCTRFWALTLRPISAKRFPTRRRMFPESCCGLYSWEF